MKKIITGIMMMCMIITMLACNVSAAEATEKTENYISKIIPYIVPQDTPLEDIPLLCADYESGILEYDYRLHERISSGDQKAYEEGWNYFDHPEISLKTGKGNCTSYSGIFCMLVSAIPVNPDTGKTDYNCLNPIYLESAVVGNKYHAFTVIDMDGTWHLYDICFYDETGDMEYLDITDTKILRDKHHRDWKLLK